jgi:chemotaxis signal transduction protein
LFIVSNSSSMVENSTAYLVARSAGETFGIPAAPVVRVLRNLTVHGVPGAVPPLLGVMQFAGEPVPVIGLAELQAGRPMANHEVVVLVRCGDGGGTVLGLAVDDAVRLVGVGVDADPVWPDGPISDPVVVEGLQMRVVDPGRIGAER